MTTAPCH